MNTRPIAGTKVIFTGWKTEDHFEGDDPVGVGTVVEQKVVFLNENEVVCLFNSQLGIEKDAGPYYFVLFLSEIEKWSIS